MAFRVIKQRREARRLVKMEELFAKHRVPAAEDEVGHNWCLPWPCRRASLSWWRRWRASSGCTGWTTRRWQLCKALNHLNAPRIEHCLLDGLLTIDRAKQWSIEITAFQGNTAILCERNQYKLYYNIISMQCLNTPNPKLWCVLTSHWDQWAVVKLS